jgi:hypothetical protein
MVLLSYYCRPAMELKQKTHRQSAVGLVKFSRTNQNPAAALVSSAFVSSRFKLQFMSEVYADGSRGQVQAMNGAWIKLIQNRAGNFRMSALNWPWS